MHVSRRRKVAAAFGIAAVTTILSITGAATASASPAGAHGPFGSRFDCQMDAINAHGGSTNISCSGNSLIGWYWYD